MSTVNDDINACQLLPRSFFCHSRSIQLFFKLTIILASQYTPLSSQHISSNINISLSRFLHTNLFHFSLIPVPRAKVMVNFERREYKETEKNSRGSELIRKLDQIKVGQMPAV
jgi:hypothetical protein